MGAYIAGTTIGEAYRRALEEYVGGLDQDHLVVEVEAPVETVWVPNSLHVEDWAPGLNLGWEYDVFCGYDFDHESTLVGGTDGRAWLDDRLHELYRGMYAERLRDPDQVGMVIDRLKQRMHGSCTNALVVQVFRDEDLGRACVSRPNNGDMACVTQLQFHPKRDRLNLHMVLRSQYIDLKGYGNLVAAATLLSNVCARTGYRPGHIIEHVNNVTALAEEHPRALAARFAAYDGQEEDVMYPNLFQGSLAGD